MASYYPHKQTVVITIVCALAVIGTAIYIDWTKPSETSRPVVSVSTTNKTDDSSNAKLVSDDWKKQFLVSGSSTTSLSRSVLVLKEQDLGPLTLTDQFGRNFFTSYMQLKQSNLTTNDKAVGDAVDYTIGNTLAVAAQPKFYSASDIFISTDVSADSIRSYGNFVGSAFIKYSPQTDAAEVASNAFNAGNMDLLTQIDPIISGYQKTINALISIPTPTSVAKYHIDLINGLSSIMYVAQGLRGSEKDPMQAMIALGTYDVAHTILESALLNIKNYFDSNDISYSTNEAGSVLSTVAIVTQ
ncbi:MAG: hypothetical protein AAB470_02225 [Patescibacteria group bacterium]